MKTVEFVFDFVSPNAYIASQVLPKIAEAADAKILWTPIVLGGVMKATENTPPFQIRGKSEWMRRDIARFVADFDIPFNYSPFFPVNTIGVMRGAVAYLGAPELPTYVDRCFREMWVMRGDLSDPATIGRIVADVGFDTREFEMRVGAEETKAKLKHLTRDAVERGVFGSPSFFIGDAMHFGQDRLFRVAADLGVDLARHLSKFRQADDIAVATSVVADSAIVVRRGFDD